MTHIYQLSSVGKTCRLISGRDCSSCFLVYGVCRGIGIEEAVELTIPPEITTLKASSMDIDRLMTSSSGTIAYQPVVGLGVVGIKTLNIGRAI